MGLKLNVRKKCIIEYADTDWFGDVDMDAANSFLIELCVRLTGVSPYSNCEDRRYGDSLEFNMESWNMMIEEMKSRNPNRIAFSTKDCKYDNGEMLRIMKEIKDNADPQQSYIYLDWF